MTGLVLLLLLVSLCQGETPLGSALQTNDTLDTIFSEYFQWKLKTYPEWATLEGLGDYNNLVEDFSMEAIRTKVRKCQEFYKRSRRLEATSEDYKLYKEVFEAELLPCNDGLKYKGYLFPPINFLEGIQTSYPRLVSEKKYTKLGSIKDYQDLQERLSKIPAMISQIIELLKTGMREGVTYARESLVGVDGQLEALQGKAEDSPFYTRFRDMPGSLGRHLVDRTQTQAANITQNQILPAFKRLQEFLKYEYSQKLRSPPGVSTIPNGVEFYSAALNWHLGTGLSPEEVQSIGFEEVTQIKEQVKGVIQEMGLNMTFREFADLLRNDKTQMFSTAEEALDTYNAIIKKANNKLSTLFPSEILTDDVYNLRVEASPPGGAIAYYESATKTFFVKLEPLEIQTKYEATTLTLHEGNPGHNLQQAVAENQENFPDFMRKPMFERYSEAPSRFNMPTVHTEGWGLYSEYLGLEMEMYEEKYARLGHYSYNLLRACRLVVDTGMHALGWTRDQAVQYMLDNTALTEESVEGEVDRYITWPGQACAYKIGERKIRELRSLSEERLGEKFDVKEFHLVALKCVGGLTVLERCVEDWIEATARPSPGNNLTYDFEETSGAGVSQATLALLSLTLLAL